MYAAGFRGRSYRYRVRDGAGWVDKEQAFPRYAFVEANLLRAQSNLYFTAGLLAMWRDQHATVDHSFEQYPHRHFVSHFVWGDKVKSARAEDRIFGDRRRLLGYYGTLAPRPTIRYLGLELGSPLDGAPRVVSSGLGFARDGGRSHRGIDIESEWGETVRAIGDGRVVFSGVDLPGRQEHTQLRPAQTNEYDRKALGFGGRYVCIAHEGGSAPLRSCSMHLDTVLVGYGEKVTRGQPIGTVGRTGMTRSAPHLHLELLSGDLLDGLSVLRGILIGNPLEPGDLEWGEPGSGGSQAF
jgi:murein DD-endopeptidase MepM/ murein hydrolase activator NlpD